MSGRTCRPGADPRARRVPAPVSCAETMAALRLQRRSSARRHWLARRAVEASGFAVAVAALFAPRWAPDRASARTGAGGALPGGGAGLCGLGVGVCVAVGAGSRIVPAGGGAGCGAAGARAVTGVASRVAESAAVGAEFAVAAAFGIELAVSAEVFGAELAGVAGLSAATRLVALVLTRARRASAGFAKSEFSDCASGEGLAMVFAEDARRRTGAGVGGAVSDALPPVGATLGLRLRGAFGRSASSMRRSLAASEHGEPCARLC